jgi:hypothetical protein
MRDYAIKCSDENQVKLQVGRSDLYRKIIQALWINDDGYYTFQSTSLLCENSLRLKAVNSAG